MCGKNPYQSQRSMIALKSSPSTKHTTASGTRRRSAGASRAPTAPHAAQPSICCGVQTPWPRNRLETNAAIAPVATPARRPSATPATTATTVTGWIPGSAENRTRPAAAAEPSVATTASSRVESGPDSNQAMPAVTSAAAPSRVASAPSLDASAATSRPAATSRRLRVDAGTALETDDAVGHLGRPG